MSSRACTFLGTASQAPTRTRNHNALFLRWDELGILFDPGEGTQRQMLLAGLSSSQITHICITHFHGDHCLGLAGIIQRLSLDRVDHPVEVIYPASGQVYFERLRHASSFYEVATLVPRPVAVSVGEEVVIGRAGKGNLIARALDHGIDCQGYRLQEDSGVRMLPERLAECGISGASVRRLMLEGQLEVAGRVVKLEEVSEYRPGQSCAVIMDTRLCPGAEALAQGVDLLVCESTYQQTEAAEAYDHFHMTAAGAADLASRAGAKRLALTHFSQRYPTREGFQAEASAMHGDVHVADDLSQVHLPARRSKEG
jgi:ribonuclease Z